MDEWPKNETFEKTESTVVPVLDSTLLSGSMLPHEDSWASQFQSSSTYRWVRANRPYDSINRSSESTDSIIQKGITI